MECKLEFIYQTTHDSLKYIASHKHECYELVYYVKGAGRTEIDEKDFTYNQDSFTVIPPNLYHDEYHDTDTEVLYIGFKYSNKKFSIKAGLYNDTFQHTVLNYLKQMKKEITDQRRHFEVKIDLLLKELLIEFERMNENNISKTNDFTYIINFLEENYNQNINLNALAELSGYSYHHFRHLFKQKTGMPPNKYIIKQRISNAERLLRETHISIVDISQECGFSNESQFSAMFKDIVGFKPSEYRRQHFD